MTLIATARNSTEANELNALARRAKGRLRVVALDAVDRESIRACADEVGAMLWESEGIDYLVVNAEMVRHSQHRSCGCCTAQITVRISL